MQRIYATAEFLRCDESLSSLIIRIDGSAGESSRKKRQRRFQKNKYLHYWN